MSTAGFEINGDAFVSFTHVGSIRCSHCAGDVTRVDLNRRVIERDCVLLKVFQQKPCICCT